jgi:endonuclease/exonuclease/phosphatase (EEP) superfamily protein YafD
MQSLEDELGMRQRRPRLQGRRISLMVRHALGWIPVVLLIAATLPRALGWEMLTPLPPLLAVTPFVPIVALAALLVTALLRLPAAAAVMAGILMVYAVWLAPRWTAEPPPASALRLKVMTVNLLFGTADPAALVALVQAEHPDVLVLVELTPAAVAALDRAGLRGELPYQVLEPFDRAAGTGIYARVPLRHSGRAPTAFAAPRAILQWSGRTVTVQAAHPVSPTPGLISEWRSDLRAIAANVAQVDGPLIALGDFNATLDHASFRHLLKVTGLRDAHDARGRGLVRTWPQGRRLPAFAHLDHVLVSPELAVGAVREHAVVGSDHRAVVAELAVR